MRKQRTKLISMGEGEIGPFFRCEAVEKSKGFAEFCPAGDGWFYIFSSLGDHLLFDERDIEDLIDALNRVKREYKKADRKKKRI